MAYNVIFHVQGPILTLFTHTGSAAQTSPVFTEDVYQALVPETFVEEGYFRPEDGFIRVGCLDPDSGVTYAITESDPGQFSLDPSTGFLSVTADLDYETNPSYTFHVRCSDVDFPSLTDTATVVIIISSVNEYHPTVSPQSANLFLLENQDTGIVIASSFPDTRGEVKYTVTDLDSGPHGIESVRYTQINTDNSENAQDFSLDFTTGALVLSGSLDVDNLPAAFDTVTLRITVCDVQPPLQECSNLVVNVLVFSANDNSPQFSANSYEVSVPETTPVNSTLDLQLLCTDGDRGAGELEGIELENSTMASIWDVNITHGTITLREQLDFEVSDRHEFVVRCFDTGGLEDFASVVINVVPVNDIPPQFITGAVGQSGEALYRFSVDRIDTADGYVVGQVQAVDNDTEAGNELSYSIEGDSHFDVNSATGEITLTDFIFAIEGSSFTLTVTVSDGDFNSTATVEVKVIGLLSLPEVAIIVSVVLVILAFSVIVGACCCITRVIKKRKLKINTEEVVEMTACQAYNRAPQVQQRLAYNRAPLVQQDRAPEMDPGYETIPYLPASEQLAMGEPTIDHHELGTIPWQAQIPQDVSTPSGHDYEYVP